MPRAIIDKVVWNLLPKGDPGGRSSIIYVALQCDCYQLVGDLQPLSFMTHGGDWADNYDQALQGKTAFATDA
ncbi:hypothetical protein [Acidithrix ferrooxidans]|uniref:Uncharacterized protein n=1 Tax=Acidithrix ferrooxidans TaxID=1280514 RepID=A0A0D8HDS7_9ACTN|nr:hypothetical protein [Acidithrix ferrooxidans]KJF16115.1 hypothetical protein AXFE_30210 [Acidithrix ferrooxidans]CAG4914359.1 unnamed protein product [Acidithrix sp. C25]